MVPGAFWPSSVIGFFRRGLLLRDSKRCCPPASCPPPAVPPPRRRTTPRRNIHWNFKWPERSKHSCLKPLHTVFWRKGMLKTETNSNFAFYHSEMILGTQSRVLRYHFCVSQAKKKVITGGLCSKTWYDFKIAFWRLGSKITNGLSHYYSSSWNSILTSCCYAVSLLSEPKRLSVISYKLLTWQVSISDSSRGRLLSCYIFLFVLGYWELSHVVFP